MNRDEARQLLREELGRNYQPKILRLIRLLKNVRGVYNRSPLRGRRALGDPIGDLVLALEDMVKRAGIGDS